jgi:hypothetical protein
MRKYFRICGHIQNTIIVCLNKYDRIIGGFTPHRMDYNNRFQEDKPGNCWMED